MNMLELADMDASEFGGVAGMVVDEENPTPAEQLRIMYAQDAADPNVVPNPWKG